MDLSKDIQKNYLNWYYNLVIYSLLPESLRWIRELYYFLYTILELSRDLSIDQLKRRFFRLPSDICWTSQQTALIPPLSDFQNFLLKKIHIFGFLILINPFNSFFKLSYNSGNFKIWEFGIDSFPPIQCLNQDWYQEECIEFHIPLLLQSIKGFQFWVHLQLLNQPN